MFLFIFKTERDRAWAGKRQRERETQKWKQAPGSEPSAQSSIWGSNSQTVRSWPEPKLDAQLTEPPRRPSISFFLIFNVYLCVRETDRVWVGEGQRERETQNRKQAPGSEPSAQSSIWGSNSQMARPWPEPKSDAQPTEPPRRPITFLNSTKLYLLPNYSLFYLPFGSLLPVKGGSKATQWPSSPAHQLQRKECRP